MKIWNRVYILDLVLLSYIKSKNIKVQTGNKGYVNIHFFKIYISFYSPKVKTKGKTKGN